MAPSDQTNSSPVMLSALQHYLFCPRQCALIHVEGVWSENYLTASGRQMHERVDRRGAETRKGVHLATSVRLVSERLGLTGVADMVEFHRQETQQDETGQCVAAKLPGRGGFWRPFPVEYKRGCPKSHRADEVQLCAQAMCLEEMLDVRIPSGALYYGETRRRTDVVFDGELRSLTENVVAKVHQLIESGETPPPVLTKGCKACSLFDYCRPEDVGGIVSAKRWIKNQLEAVGT
ncbi:MAG: CRISPR-associated protein Cas4 [Kiritimatiellae bacterium]|nr:CRISPR-associated protein Cas4 [Kiritimatiellia bacterium]